MGMKTLKAFALFFVLATLPVSAELVQDPETDLKTGTITANGETYVIKPGADLSRATSTKLFGIPLILELPNLKLNWQQRL